LLKVLFHWCGCSDVNVGQRGLDGAPAGGPPPGAGGARAEAETGGYAGDARRGVGPLAR